MKNRLTEMNSSEYLEQHAEMISEKQSDEDNNNNTNNNNDHVHVHAHVVQSR